jgi:hypothetical protein
MSKKWISIAAAAVITAGLVGCGGSSNSSSSGTTSSTSSSVTAVDDYIYNAQVVAGVIENNKTVEYNLTTNVLYKTIDDGKWHGGSSTYSLPAELQGKVIKYYKLIPVTDSKILTKLSNDAVNCEDDNIYCPLTFMDNNDTTINGQVVKDDADTNLNTQLQSVAGASVVTPVTNLIATIINNGYANNAAVNYQLETNATYRDQFNKAIENNVSDIAPKLGFKNSDDMIKADPMKMDPVEAKAAVLMFNAVRDVIANGNSGALITQLQKATTKPADLKDAVVTTLYTAITTSNPGTNAAKVLNKVKKQVDAGVKLDDILASIDPVNSVNDGDIRTKTVENTKDTMYLKAVTLNDGSTDKNTTDMYSNGMKLNGLTDVKLDWATKSVDTNITDNKPFNIIVSFQYNKGFVKESDTNTSEKVTIVIPAEINASKDGDTVTFDGKIINSDEKKVQIYVLSTDKEKSKTIEANASALSIDDKFDGKTIKVKDIVAKVFENAIDNNVSDSVNVIAENNVTKFGVYVEKGASLKQATFSGDELKATLPVAQTTVKTPNASYEVYSLLDNGDNWTDFRGNFGENNKGKSSTSSLATTNSKIYVNNITVNGSPKTYDINETRDTNATLSFSNSSADTFEKNTTVSNIKVAKGVAVSFNYTSLKDIDQVTKVQGVNELNITVKADDVNKAEKGSHPTTLITYRTTDEFGAYTDQNFSIWYNRAPKVELSTDTDKNRTYIFTDLDNDEINATANQYVTILEANGTEANLTGTVQTVTVKGSSDDHNVTAKLVWLDDKNSTLGIEFNESLPSKIEKDATGNDWNLSIKEYNITDKYNQNVNAITVPVNTLKK